MSCACSRSKSIGSKKRLRARIAVTAVDHIYVTPGHGLIDLTESGALTYAAVGDRDAMDDLRIGAPELVTSRPLMGGLPAGKRVRFLGTRIWMQSLSFYVRHPLALAAVAPLLLMPLFADVLTAALIGQGRRSRQLQPMAAVQQALQAMPAFLRLKLFYFARGLLWSLVPIYGLIRNIDERLAWAMTSNVVVLEGHTDFATARTRCEGLVANFRGECIRVLLTLPVTLLIPVFVGIALAQARWILWLILLATVFVFIPASAAANTYLYLWIRDEEAAHGEPAEHSTGNSGLPDLRGVSELRGR
jgi:hypothetical protein